MRQLEGVESVRSVSLAQQETVALAQLLKSQQQTHQQEVHTLTEKTERDIREAREKLEKVN